MYAMLYTRYIHQWQGLVRSRPHRLRPPRPGDNGNGKGGQSYEGYTILYHTILYCNIRRNIYDIYELCICAVQGYIVCTNVQTYEKFIIMMVVSIRYIL